MGYIKLERTFYAVGQGSFCSEIFYEKLRDKPCFTMVYDCGVNNKSKNNNLTREIDNFNQNIGDQTPIDLLCISHFDKDHVSGLEILLKNRKVKNILVPLLAVYDIFLLLAKCEKSAFTSVSDVLYDVYHPAANRYARVIVVSPISGDSESNRDEPNNDSISLDEEEHGQDRDTSTKHKVLQNNGVLSVSRKLNGLNWEFKPFYMSLGLPKNFKNSLKKELRIRLNNHSGNEEDLKKELLKLFKTPKITHTDIKTVYKKIIAPNKKPKSVDINRYSLCLYSGAKNQVNSSRGIMSAPRCAFCHPCFYYSPCWENCYCRQSLKTGCLYLGDYEAKKEYLNPLLTHYDAYNRKVDILQIPHHGAVNNWNIGLPDFFNPKIAFAQAGLSNTYGHPSYFVIKESSQYACTFIITEDPENLTICYKIDF